MGKKVKNVPAEDQQKLIDYFKDNTLFEFMHIEEVSGDDPRDFMRLWKENIQRLKDHIDETDRMFNKYYYAHFDEIYKD